MTHSNAKTSAFRLLTSITLAMSLLFSSPPAAVAPRTAATAAATLSPQLRGVEQSFDNVLDALSNDRRATLSLEQSIERFIDKTVSDYKNEKDLRRALTALAEGKSGDTLKDLTILVNSLQDFPLLRHIRAQASAIELIQTTFKTMSLKVDANGGFLVCVVTWPSQGPLGFKTINDKLGWDVSDRIRAWIFSQVTETAQESFTHDHPPKSADEAQARIERILHSTMRDFISMLRTARELNHDDSSLGLNKGTIDYFVEHADSFRIFATASYSVSKKDGLNLPDTVKTLTRMEDFAMAKARLAENNGIGRNIDKDDALLRFAEIIEDPELKTDDLDYATLTRIRKGAEVAAHLEKTARVLNVFGRPKPYSVNDSHAFSKATMASYLQNRLYAMIRQILANDGEVARDTQYEIEDLCTKIRALEDFDPRSVSIDYMSKSLPDTDRIKAIRKLDPQVTEIMFMSKSRYTETFLQALENPRDTYEKIEKLRRSRSGQDVPVEVFGDEALFLSVMKQADGSLAPTEIYTDVKGLGVENLKDCLRLVNVHRHMAAEIKTVSAADFEATLDALIRRFLEREVYCTSAARLLAKNRAEWRRGPKTNERLAAIKDMIRRESAEMVISEAEDRVTLNLRLSELLLTGTYAAAPPTNSADLNSFAKTVIDSDRRCVAVTLTDRAASDEIRKQEFKTLEEYGLSTAKKLEERGLKNFFLHYTGTKSKGEWRIIFCRDGVYRNRALSGIAALLLSGSRPQEDATASIDFYKAA